MAQTDETAVLPENLSLAEVFSMIMLAPHEINTLLQSWASDFQGGAQLELSAKLHKAAAMVVDVETYRKPPREMQNVPVYGLVRHASEPGDAEPSAD